MHENHQGPSAIDYLKAWPQYLLPGHLISRLTLGFTRIRSPWIKNPFTDWFIRHFDVDLSEARISDAHTYEHFNAFFTRALKEDARPMDEAVDAVVSPVDGTVIQYGAIEEGRIIQAKGHDYSLQELLGGSEKRAQPFQGGDFITIYLSPSDYHRIHMPIAGKLTEMVHVPGRLFSVNPATNRVVPGLFTRNERVISRFDTDRGAMAMVKVGAINVGSIETVWAGQVTPPAGRIVKRWLYEGEEAVSLAKGEEMGRFNMGSTVILLFPPETVVFEEEMKPNHRVRLGERIATLK